MVSWRVWVCKFSSRGRLHSLIEAKLYKSTKASSIFWLQWDLASCKDFSWQYRWRCSRLPFLWLLRYKLGIALGTGSLRSDWPSVSVPVQLQTRSKDRTRRPELHTHVEVCTYVLCTNDRKCLVLIKVGSYDKNHRTPLVLNFVPGYGSVYGGKKCKKLQNNTRLYVDFC